MYSMKAERLSDCARELPSNGDRVASDRKKDFQGLNDEFSHPVAISCVSFAKGKGSSS